MTRAFLLLPAIAGATCSITAAQTLQLDWINNGVAGTSISGDGSVIVGNIVDDGSYETFRWVQGDESYTRLGRATVPVLGRGAGTPDVSDDGTRVSATVLTTDETLVTFGLWTDGLGWQTQDVWPMAADNGEIDQSIASTWGLSGDGEHVTGFYWTTNGRAHPATWSPTGGAVPLEMRSTTQSSRVNASNADGTVVAGWSESTTGSWQPTVWVNGVLTVLDTIEAGLDAVEAVNADGTVLVGQSYDPPTGRHVATVWRWDGTQWNTEKLGRLTLGSALSVCTGVSADGSVIVGTNYFTYNGPFSDSTGFVWTAATGMQDIETLIADQGLSLPAGYDVSGLEDVSADGTAAVGIALDANFYPGTFRVRFVEPCPADVDGNGTLNLDDVNTFAAAFVGGDLLADVDGNGMLNLDDVNIFATSFVAGCP